MLKSNMYFPCNLIRGKNMAGNNYINVKMISPKVMTIPNIPFNLVFYHNWIESTIPPTKTRGMAIISEK